MPVNLAATLRDIELQQRAIMARMRVLKAKFNELEKQRKSVLRKIEKVVVRLERQANQEINDTIIRKVERQINREGWMERIIENRFRYQAEHGRGSQKWAKLSPITIKRKGFNRILFETGEMYHGALQAVADTYRYGQTPSWNIDDVGVDYAAYHQTGTDRMPARPFLDAPTEKEMAPIERRVIQLTRAEMRKNMRAG